MLLFFAGLADDTGACSIGGVSIQIESNVELEEKARILQIQQEKVDVQNRELERKALDRKLVLKERLRDAERLVLPFNSAQPHCGKRITMAAMMRKMPITMKETAT